MMLGDVLGPYRILGKLGEGGMGEVYRARDTQLKRDVALKVLPAEVAGDPERLARFQREAELLAALNHPHICTLFGLGQAVPSGSGGLAPSAEPLDPVHYLVMELVEGETLAERIARHSGSHGARGLQTSGTPGLPLDEALPIAQQLAEAIEYAHEHGIIHRDLKPANIKLTPDGAVKVLDFGLAKLGAGDSGLGAGDDIANSPTVTSPARLRQGYGEAGTRVGVILGTAAYMAPEQARGAAVDKRADIWAFGVVLFEMLAGRPCFAGDTVTDVLAAIVKTEPDWAALPAGTPPRVRDLLRRCLAKDRRQRLRDIGDARLELDAAGAGAAAPADEAPRPARRARTAALIGALVLSAAAAASLVTWRLLPAPEQPVIRSTVDLPANVELSRGEQGPANREVALSPDGKLLVFSAGPAGADARTMLYARALDSLEVAPVAGTEGARAPFFSPDGRWVAFWAQGRLRKWPTAGGIPADIAEWPIVPQGAAWSSRGDIVLGTDADGLHILRAGDRAFSRLTTPDNSREASHVLPHFLPGGERLVFTVKPHRWGTRSRVEALGLAGGERTVLIESGADARLLPTGHLAYMAEGTLMAVPFDPDRLKLTGQALPLVHGVAQALNALNSDENSGAAQWSSSADGTLVYAAGSIYPDLETRVAWVDREGRTEPAVPLAGLPVTSVRLSPDNRYLAYRTVGRAAEVWIYDRELQTSRRITREGRAMHLCWTPDGTRLTFAYSKAGAPGIVWTAADGSGPAEPEALVTGQHVLQPSEWSPDGRQLFFVEANPRTKADIWVYDAEARTASPWFNAEYQERYPAVSPDGRWLAYSSDETGNYQLYVAPLTHGVKGLPVTADGGLAPRWAPDGRTLYYWSPDWTTVKAMDVDLQPATSVQRRRSLFTFHALDIAWVRGFDLTRDGSRFLIPGRGAQAPVEIRRLNLVLNWHREVQAKFSSK